MAAPPPFTFSSLETFINCPKRYYHTYVIRDVKDEQGPQQIYGTDVHAHFENYLNASGKYPLPDNLLAHKPKLDNLLDKDGVFWCEQEVALDKKLQACRYDDPDRLWRGKIDFRLVDRHEKYATLVDFKTGKQRIKWPQLGIYAIHTFAQFPNVDIVNAQFYWTQNAETTKKVWSREELPQIWLMFVADLKQYRDAHKTDTWQERPSGLCRGWCPVTTCRHWQPKRES
jgi:hypothetical protein